MFTILFKHIIDHLLDTISKFRGFGAQKLVQDVITGWFILMEDTIAVGDVAEVAGHSGLVERISIRTIRLRDLSGGPCVFPTNGSAMSWSTW